MTDPRVSVVVITLDRRDELARTLRRLRDLPERPAVVVVDNASTDGTADMVQTEHPEVTLLTPGENLGAAGRNLGVEAVRTPYVAFCDDDSWYDPGALRRAADVLDAHPTLALVQAHIIVEPYGRVDGICEEMAASPLDRPPGIPGHPLLGFLGGFTVVRRSALLDVGGFSLRLLIGGEEELLAADLASAGWHMTYLPDVVAHHHASQARDPHLRRRQGIRNTLWTTWLRRPLPSAAVRTARLLRRLPRDRVTVLGVTDAVRGLPWVVRERRPVPWHVERGFRQLEDMQLDGGNRTYVS